MDQQQPFFFPVFSFFDFSFVVGTSTGINLPSSHILHFFLLVFHWGQRNLLKGWTHTVTVFSTGLKVLNLGMFLEELINRLFFYFPFRFTVDLVPHQNEGEFLRLLGSSLVQKLIYPWFNIVERLIIKGVCYFFVGDIVNKDTTVCTPIEGSSKASEFLLPCCIPNLGFATSTSKLITLPSTTTYFSMKSAPTVAL